MLLAVLSLLREWRSRRRHKARALTQPLMPASLDGRLDAGQHAPAPAAAPSSSSSSSSSSSA
eukprot:5800984-Pleurochrysis_carterae.AAC.1